MHQVDPRGKLSVSWEDAKQLKYKCFSEISVWFLQCCKHESVFKELNEVCPQLHTKKKKQKLLLSHRNLFALFSFLGEMMAEKRQMCFWFLSSHIMKPYFKIFLSLENFTTQSDDNRVQLQMFDFTALNIRKK